MKKVFAFSPLLLTLLFAPAFARAQAGGGTPSSSANRDVNPLSFSGSDLGAQINNAYASCTSSAGTGCRIAVPPGNYTVSTPVVIAAKGKNASIECSGTSTTLTWKPTSGTMFQFAANGSGSGNGWGEGIRHCNLVNATSGTTAVAVQFGVSASDTTGRTAEGAYLDDVQITGFGTQYDLESQAWNITVTHSEFLNPVTYAIYANPSASNSGENLVFAGDTVADTLGRWIPQAVNLSLGSVIAQFVGCNFDDVEVEMGAGTINLIGPYFENPGPVLRTTPWIHVLHAVSTVTGLTAADDDTGTPATQPDITVEGTLTWIGGTIFGANPATATVVTSAHGHVWMGGDLNVSAAVPEIVNNSGLPYTNWSRGLNTVSAQAIREVNPVTAGAGHWYDLEQSDGRVAYGTLLEQMASDDATNPSGFEICNKLSSTVSCAVQIHKSGHFLGLHGPPSSSWNQWLYGTTRIDSLSIAGGASITNANAIPTVGTPTAGQAACIKAAGPPVVIGYCSSAVSASGACTCN